MDLIEPEEDRVEVIFGFDELPLVFVDDEDRRDDRDETRPFCAISTDGRTRVSAIRPRGMRRSISTSLLWGNVIVGIIESS